MNRKKKMKTSSFNSSSSSIRIMVKCSWSGARLSPTATTASTNKITKKTTIDEIIQNLSHQLPPVITNETISWDDPQPYVVYLRTNVLKRDWKVTSIGDLLGKDDEDSDSIMLTLNLPKEIASSSAVDSVMENAAGGANNVDKSDENNSKKQSGDNNDDDGDGMEGTEPMDIDSIGTGPNVTTDVTHAAPATAAIAATPGAASGMNSLSSKQVIQNILQSNFDSSSIEYFKTILKIIDNILSSTKTSQSTWDEHETNLLLNDGNGVRKLNNSFRISPMDEKSVKVRTLRLSNPTVQKKIVAKQHGLDLLLHVIGFSYPLPRQVQAKNGGNNDMNHAHMDGKQPGFDFDGSSNTSNNVTSSQAEVIVLRPEYEDKTKLLSVRDDIVHVLRYELNIPPNEIPKEPFVKVSFTGTNTAPTAAASKVAFNPYKSHAFNVQSAAKGASNPNSIIPGKDDSIGSDATAAATTTVTTTSSTERQLESLQKKQQQLEESMKSKFIDRHLIAELPCEARSVVSTLINSINPGSGSGSSSSKSDGSLLAMQLKKREEERKKREEAGFTTKAMRDLEKMKNKKVYSHVQLRIYFPDGCRIEAKFLPNETVSVVKQVIRSSFSPQFQIQKGQKGKEEQQRIQGVVLLPELDFDLYISPPRKTLNDSKSLADEGLVPAAKIFVSWKSGCCSSSGSNTPAVLIGEQPGFFLQRHLFPKSQQVDGRSINSSFPESKPINEQESKSKSVHSDTTTGASSSREEEMIMKMMGKKKKGGLFRKVGGGKGKTHGNKGTGMDTGLGTDNNNGSGSSNTRSKGYGRPKWFNG